MTLVTHRSVPGSSISHGLLGQLGLSQAPVGALSCQAGRRGLLLGQASLLLGDLPGLHPTDQSECAADLPALGGAKAEGGLTHGSVTVHGSCSGLLCC